jgi:hypothetical protein
MKILLAVCSALMTAPAIAAEAVPAAPASAPPAAEAPAQPAAPAAAGTVARAQFTEAIQDREPTDTVSTLTNDKTRIYYFTELKDLENHKVTHRWEHDGKVMYEQTFDVSSPRYRTYTSKTLDPSWTGEWKVSVVDENGSTLGASTFTYEAAAPAAAPPPAPASGPAPAAPAGTTTR